ncbi:membrane hypothetical protein [Vibrio crassostreae]|nr:membrane hypothetical protein [Vibrio crassostreae]CAK2038450.1 membrane hypothetical protein [Vibrio crassostreae]CAK2170466.1 membrane hypothetical protein [Vibrio crassostreae]CAK2175415.1 membrane hypothetical protein [Vibrio crassostreae]CAK2181344.1 membrane hypothetical protein [Vibrio crassostreae]
MITNSAPLYAALSVVALKLSFLLNKKCSISLSTIGDCFLLSITTLSSIISTATTSWFCANNIAFDKPTYPVPATAIFILIPIILSYLLNLIHKFTAHIILCLENYSTSPSYPFLAILDTVLYSKELENYDYRYWWCWHDWQQYC